MSIFLPLIAAALSHGRNRLNRDNQDADVLWGATRDLKLRRVGSGELLGVRL